MLEWLSEFYEYHALRLWFIGIIGTILGLIFWSWINSSDRQGPHGPRDYH